MKTLEELIDVDHSGWNSVEAWIKQSTRPVVVLEPIDESLAKQSLLFAQVTTKSPLGAILYQTGGILIENGWIRVLGGGATLPSFYQWNLNKTITESKVTKGYLIVALDVLGGYFCLNGGGLGKDVGKVYYFAPDTLDFEPLDISYSDLIWFFLLGDTEQFYASFRWKEWQKEVLELDVNSVFDFFPPLWTKEGKNINESMKQVIATQECFVIQQDFRDGLNQIENQYTSY